MDEIVNNNIKSQILVVCEKPSAAKRIAEALNYLSKQNIKENKSSSFYSATDRKGHNYIISYALGHLYGLSDSSSNRKQYPILDPQWIPLSQKRTTDPKLKSLTFKIDKILKEILYLAKNASGFIHACDYDQEGEVIGYNILQYACQNKYFKSQRAKFSSLTDEEIRESFDNLLPPNKKLADAGLSRHMIDFIYGINLSRALSTSVKRSYTKVEKEEKRKKYYTLSIGRVQGPTLAFVVDREQEISDHIPVPYWNIEADFEKNKQIFKTIYYPPKIEKKSLGLEILNTCKNQFGKITDIDNKKLTIRPPHPFNLGELQREAYRVFRFSPSYTLSISEKLYLNALISYPRTSSQKLPSSINYKKIIKDLASFNNNFIHKDIHKIKSYSDISHILLTKKSIEPNEGKEIDPAHPSIYPTGEKPKQKLEESELKLFDLIIRRFFSTFGDNALTQNITITVTVKDKYNFKAEEKKIMTEGWITLYRPYVDITHLVTQNTLPPLNKNDIVKNTGIKLIEKQTQPPPRYNQSSLLQKMEKEKIGTKATRAEIINTLFKRNYITNSLNRSLSSTVNSDKNFSGKSTPNKIDSGTAAPDNQTLSSSYTNSNALEKSKISGTFKDQRPGIRPTDIGIAIIITMRKHVPNIVSTDLTRSMEENLEQIESGTSSSDKVIKIARDEVTKAIRFFEQNQNEIGSQLNASLLSYSNLSSASFSSSSASAGRSDTQFLVTVLGVCPLCKKGNLVIKKALKSKKRFAGCSLFSTTKCNATASLPQKGAIKGINKICEKCKWPIVSGTGYNQKKRYQWQFCINAQCPTKQESVDKENPKNPK